MGSIKVRNSLLSKRLKRTEIRLLIIDDNQLRYNQILNLLSGNDYQVNALLLDDLKSFEKQLNTSWDVIIFGRAYDLKIEQTLSLVQASEQPQLPILLLQPDDYQAQQYQSYIQKGIYDVVPLEPLDYFYITLVRALSYSRLYRRNNVFWPSLIPFIRIRKHWSTTAIKPLLFFKKASTLRQIPNI